jgi:hypothetical protein
MATKEKVLNIHQRLNAVMADVNYIKKDKKIEIGKGSYSVTGHDAVTKLIHPLLVEHGINLIPSVVEMSQEGNRTRVLMHFKWVNIDDPKDFFSNDIVAYGVDNQDKGPGKSISYAQRFLILKTLHIETGERDIEEFDIEFEKEVKKPTISVKQQQDFKNPFFDHKILTISIKQQQDFIEHVKANGMEVFTAVELINSHGFEKTKDIHVDKLEALKKEVIVLMQGDSDA